MFSRLYKINNSIFQKCNIKISKTFDYLPQIIINRTNSDASHIIQMRGLDFETQEQDVIDFFKPLGIVPKKVNLKCDGAGRTIGVSEIEFASHAEAVIAMRKKNAFMGNRFIRLTLRSTPTPETNTMRVNQNEQHAFEFPTSNTNISRSPKENIFATGHFIRMKNVPLRMNEQAIYQFFWPLGVVPISIRRLYDENGYRKNECDVEFLTHEDAVKAMSKNNAYLGNKFIELILKSNSNTINSNLPNKDQLNIMSQNTTQHTDTEKQTY